MKHSLCLSTWVAWACKLSQRGLVVWSYTGMNIMDEVGTDLGDMARSQTSPDQTGPLSRARSSTGYAAHPVPSIWETFHRWAREPRGANPISHTLCGQCHCFFPRVILSFPGLISTWLVKLGLHRTPVCQVLEGLGKLNCFQITRLVPKGLAIALGEGLQSPASQLWTLPPSFQVP